MKYIFSKSIPYEDEVKERHFAIERKRNFVTSKPTGQEMLMEVPQVELK